MVEAGAAQGHKIRSKSLDFEFEEEEGKQVAEVVSKPEPKRGIFSSLFGKIFSRSKKERKKIEQTKGDG